MGKKYRMKTLWAYDDCSDVGIELEPLEQEEKPSQWNCLNCGKSYFIEPANDLDVDCPASECDGEECGCKVKFDGGLPLSVLNGKPKEPKTIQGVTLDDVLIHEMETNESLEEKKLVDKFGYYKPKHCTDMNGEMSGHDCYALAQIAKEHYQEHPEEIGIDLPAEGVKKLAQDVWREKGMVSIDEVLRVFDEALKNMDKGLHVPHYLRKAIEKLKEKDVRDKQ